MSQANRLKVLVVEDHLEEAFPLATLLGADGNNVRIASDGETALRKVLFEPPDVMVLDLGLPKLDGLEVAVAVREAGLYRRPWILAVSGHDEPWVLEDAAAVGVDAYFVKPVEPERLRAVLRSLPPTGEVPEGIRERRQLLENRTGDHPGVDGPPLIVYHPED
jgi:DNA-binding response OmpR family regulator